MLNHPSPSTTLNEHEFVDANHGVHHGESFLTIAWRFRWLFFVMMPIGLLIGHFAHQQQPTLYRASTKLLFKSDKPLALDKSTGLVIGGIPSGKLIQSLLVSDPILEQVANDDELLSVSSLAGMEREKLFLTLRSGITFVSVTDSRDAHDRMIGELGFSSQDPDLCVAVVSAASRAVDQHFRDEREANINEFCRLVGNAQNKLLPQQELLETEYKEFRDSVSLEWDSNGQRINPYRQELNQLQARHSRLSEEIREIKYQLRLALGAKSRIDDPLMVALIIGNRTDVFHKVQSMSKPNDKLANEHEIERSDLELQRINLEKKLLPLEVKLNEVDIGIRLVASRSAINRSSDPKIAPAT